MPYVTVDVDIDVDEFDDDDLIEELERRKYYVSREPIPEMSALDKYEVEYLLDLVDKAEKKFYSHYNLREKLRTLA